MKDTTSTYGSPLDVKMDALSSTLNDLIAKQEIESFVGTVLTTKGVLVLFFSHRYNRDTAILVSGTDTTKVLGQVFEALATPSKKEARA